MAKLFLTPIDLNKNELRNVVTQNLATAPSSPVEGQRWYDSNTGVKTEKFWNGTAWQIVDATKLSAAIPNSALTTNPLARANHTGTQLSSTISDFTTAVQSNRLDQMAAPTGSVSFNGQLITGLSTSPSASGHAAEYSWTLAQIQASAAGLDVKLSVRLVATTNVGLSGLAAIDGVTPVANDRVLVVGQTTASQNGIYVAASGAWTRSSDCNSSTNYTPAAFTFVEEGTTYGASQWKVTTTGTITVGTTSVTWVQFGAASSYTAGNGLSLAGSTFSVNPVASGGISVSGSGVQVDTTIVTRKYVTSIGNGSLTSIAVTHSLGTLDTVVQVYDNSTFATVECDVVRTSTSVVTLTFTTAPTSNQYRVVVHG